MCPELIILDHSEQNILAECPVGRHSLIAGSGARRSRGKLIVGKTWGEVRVRVVSWNGGS